MVLALLASRTRRPLFVLVPDDAAADAWRRDLAAAAALAGEDPSRLVPFPALDADPWDDIAPHPEVGRDRVIALSRLSRGEVGLIVAGYGLSHRLIGQDVFSASVIMVLVTTMVTPPLLRLVFPRGTEHHVDPLVETIAKVPEEIADMD